MSAVPYPDWNPSNLLEGTYALEVWGGRSGYYHIYQVPDGATLKDAQVTFALAGVDVGRMRLSRKKQVGYEWEVVDTWASSR
jgi:hypothetical protein